VSAQTRDLSVLLESRHVENDDEDGERHKPDADDNMTDTTAVSRRAGATEGRDGLVSSSDLEIVTARLSCLVLLSSRAGNTSVTVRKLPTCILWAAGQNPAVAFGAPGGLCRLAVARAPGMDSTRGVLEPCTCLVP
jgi:hypothetical protein